MENLYSLKLLTREFIYFREHVENPRFNIATKGILLEYEKKPRKVCIIVSLTIGTSGPEDMYFTRPGKNGLPAKSA